MNALPAIGASDRIIRIRPPSPAAFDHQIPVANDALVSPGVDLGRLIVIVQLDKLQIVEEKHPVLDLRVPDVRDRVLQNMPHDVVHVLAHDFEGAAGGLPIEAVAGDYEALVDGDAVLGVGRRFLEAEVVGSGAVAASGQDFALFFVALFVDFLVRVFPVIDQAVPLLVDLDGVDSLLLLGQFL